VADNAGAAAYGDERSLTFRGVTELVLDAKGRLAVPAKHRDALLARGLDRLIITADQARCLLLYPVPEWLPLEANLIRLSAFDPTIRQLQRLLIGHAEEVDIDAAGRILVPPALRKYAGLDREVVLVGQGRKLELWDEASWQAQTAQPIVLTAGALPAGLEGFSL
jgi:MraZ protein